MARTGSSGSGGRRIGGGNSPPRPPIFRSEAERKAWNSSEGARKRAARRWMNWGLTPPGKLARYARSGEGSSSGSCRPPLPPVYDSSSDDEDDAAPLRLTCGDFVHDSDEEEAVIHQVSIVSVAEERARFRREEADAVRQVRAYEAAQKEARVRRIKRELVELDELQTAPPPSSASA